MREVIQSKDFDNAFRAITGYIRQARGNVLKSVNHEQVVAYWHIGKKIVEQEQLGENRAEYGANLLQILSEKLTEEFGRGFAPATLRSIRQFYIIYKNRICSEPRSELIQFDKNLSWTHYKMLMREPREDVRRFYEIEASQNCWSTPQLERQMTSFLYDRLSHSKDKQTVLEYASQGQIIRKPEDSLKDPVVLDFLGYKQDQSYTENELESSIISHLQEFLLEMGKGFAFIGRQVRITLESDHFYPDLVFYHTILKCYIIIELKTKKLVHGNISQLQMYVNYYDRVVKQEDDNPTIGLLLCAEQNDTVVKYTLPENNRQIFSRKYQLHLPTEEQLKQELSREYQVISQQFASQTDEGDEK